MEIDEKLIRSVFEMGRVVRKKMQDVDFSHSLSHPQIQTLKFVDLSNGSTMKEIAKFLRVKPPTATATISSLVKSGELKRVEDNKDRRIIKIETTKKGKKILEESFVQISKELKKIFLGLNIEDKKKLIEIMSKIKE